MSKPHVSPSSLTTYCQCGMRYYFRKIEGLRIKAPGHFVVGDNVHDAGEQSLQNMINNGALFGDEQLADFARTNFDKAEEKNLEYSDGIIYDDEMTRGKCIDQSIALAACYNSEIAPTLKPAFIEKPFVINTGEYPYDLMGFIDIETLDAHIQDIKTVKTIMPVIERNIQGISYCLNYKVEHKDDIIQIDPTFSLGCIKKNIKPKAVVLSGQYNDDDYEQLYARIDMFAKGLAAGVFVPAPPDWWGCSEKWCGYYTYCPYGKKQRVQVAMSA